MKKYAQNILMINHFAIPPDMPGGSRHYDFGVELVKRGYKVTIFTTDFSYATLQRMKLRRFQMSLAEEYDGVRFVWIRSTAYKKNNWRRTLNMLSFALNMYLIGLNATAPDVIIGSSPHLFAALTGYLLSRIKGSKFFFEVRDLWPQTLIDMGAATENSFSVKILRRIEKLLYNKAAKIIVLAEGSREYIKQRGIAPEKILYLPNGVHIDLFRITESRENIRARLGVKEKFVAMYAGAHGAANALHTIIETGELLKDNDQIEFVLIGDGPDKMGLQQVAAQKGLKNIKFLPSVPKKEIPNYLNAADALVITLRAVGLFSYGVSPNKLFDYMAAAKPVVCAVGGEMANLVKEADAGIAVEPEDAAGLADALICLMKDSAKCAMYGTNGRKFIKKNFSRERMADVLIHHIA